MNSNAKNPKSTNKIKNALAIFSLLLMYPVLAIAQSDTNLITNPGFESGSTIPMNWILVSQNGNTPIWDTISHSGSKSIKISIPGITDLKSGYPISNLITVQPLTNYTVSAWGKTIGAGGTNTPAVRVVELDANKNYLRQTNLPVFSKGTNDWTEKKLEFKTDSNTGYIYVYANIWNGYGTFWMDDVTVSSVTGILSSISARSSTNPSDPGSSGYAEVTMIGSGAGKLNVYKNGVLLGVETTSAGAWNILDDFLLGSGTWTVGVNDGTKTLTTQITVGSSPTTTPTTPTVTPAPTPTPDPSGSTCYVAKNGDDSNPGTEAMPWLTIRKAANMLVAGETVYIKQGTYNEQITVKNSGSAGKYIAFSAYPGDTVTVDGSGLNMEDWSGLFWINGKNYIKVIGFNLINGRTGVRVESASNIILKDNYIENPYHCGICVGWGYPSNIIIDGNTIKRDKKYEWNEMISIFNSYNVEVKNNHIMENAIGEGIDMKDGTTDSTIHHNVIENTASAGVYIDGYADGVSNIEVYNNIVHHSTIGFSTGSERGGLTQNIYFHDNIANDTDIGYRISYSAEDGYEVSYKNITFRNNIAYDNIVDYSGI